MKNSLIEQFAPEVKQFCVENLAGVLYRCVEHPEPRFDIDGETARLAIEKYISNNSIIDNYSSVLRNLTAKFLIASAYQEVRRIKPHMPELNLTSINHDRLLSPEFLNLNQRLMFLTDSEFENLISEIPSNQKRIYQEQFLGRDVWELFYQRLKKESLFLDSKGYGEIKFR